MELAIRLMIHKEARECVDRINSNMNNIRSLVLELYEREGWTALGYASWRECVVAEFNQNERYLYRQLEAAQTQKQICPNGQKTEIPESQLRPLTKLRDNPDQQKEAWQKAVETAPEGKVTAAHVQKVVNEFNEPIKTEHEKTDTTEESDVIFHLKRWWKKATKKDKQLFLTWIERG